MDVQHLFLAIRRTWGWFRLAWLPDNPRENPAVPFHTYDLRARAAGRMVDEYYLWKDAT